MIQTNKWKTGLLKTGVPLEYVTSNILTKINHTIIGEFPYLRPNENKEFKEFSVDIRTHKTLVSDERLIILSYLVECKYRQQNTNWIFSPYPSQFVPIGIVQSTEDLVPIRLTGDNVYKFEESLGYCISGIELDNSGNGKNDGVKHGVFQLKYAMPVLIKSSYNHVLKHVFAKGKFIDLMCPILVTTADIRVMKKGTSLMDFENANALEEITELREAVILNENPGPQLQEFADLLSEDFLNSHPILEQRLRDLDKVLVGKDWEKRYAPDIDTIKRSFSSGTERILVVNFNYLEKTLQRLELAIMKDIETSKIYGEIIETNNGVTIQNTR
jgi:hypothetical protein